MELTVSLGMHCQGIIRDKDDFDLQPTQLRASCTDLRILVNSGSFARTETRKALQEETDLRTYFGNRCSYPNIAIYCCF